MQSRSSRRTEQEKVSGRFPVCRQQTSGLSSPAAPASPLLAIQDAKDGKVAEWMEKVSDGEYLVGPTA
jgi:hypothetical protein